MLIYMHQYNNLNRKNYLKVFLLKHFNTWKCYAKNANIKQIHKRIVEVIQLN